MQSEQQQRIMGYFIEEAKDHLNIIEQGLLSLQSTMENPEMLDEVYRSAHSIKGGAAMLGIISIQKTAHRLEDCFNDLKKSPVKVDRQLESLFLQVFDTLQALVEQLQGPFGLTDDIADGIMADAEPIFEELNTHLGYLVNTAASSTIVTAEAPQDAGDRVAEETVIHSANTQLSGTTSKTLPLSFKRDVLVVLREMLQLFKEQDLPENREALQEHCQSLESFGEKLDLPGWGELLETSRAAIACYENSYRQLASLVIKEIKQAQELVVAGRSVEIYPSEQLKALVPKVPDLESLLSSEAQEEELDLTFDTNFNTESRDAETTQDDNDNVIVHRSVSSVTHLSTDLDTYIQEDIREDLTIEAFAEDSTAAVFYHQTHIQQSHSKPSVTSGSTEPSDPEVGMAELNSLADIFEGQTPDLDQTWQEEEIISPDDGHLTTELENSMSWEEQSDFSDLIGDINGVETPVGDGATADDLIGWLGEDFQEDDALHSQESTDLFLYDPYSETTLSSTGRPELSATAATPDELNNLFGDSLFEESDSQASSSLVDEENTTDFLFDTDAISEAHQDDDIFFMPPGDALDEVDVNGLEEQAPLSSSAFSPSLSSSDISLEGESSLNEMFTEEENDSLTFENSSVWELDDLESNESQSDEAAIADSELDFSDLLAISDSEAVSAPQDNLAFSEELLIDDEATDFDLDELTLDEPVTDFDFASREDLMGSDWESDSAVSSSEEATPLTSPQASNQLDLSLDDNLWDTPTNSPIDADSFIDIGLEDFLSTHELNTSETFDWDEETEDTFDDYNSVIDLEGDATDTAAAAQIANRAEANDNEALVSFGTSTWDSSPSEESAAEDLLLDEDESEFAWDEVGSTQINADNALETQLPDTGSMFDLDLDFEPTSTSAFNFDEDSHDSTNDLFENESLLSVEVPQNDAFDSLEDLEGLSDSQTEDIKGLTIEGFDLDSLEPETVSEFDTLNDFFAPETEASDTFTLDFDEEDEGALLDVEAAKAPQAAAEDLEALLGDETPDADAFDLTAVDLNDLTLEEDLFGSETSPQEWNFEAEGEAAGEAQATIFDWESTETPETSADNLESLLDDETTVENTDALDIPSVDLEALNFEEDLFEDETSSQDWNFEAEGDATGDTQSGIFNWESTETPEALDNAADLSPQASDLDALLSTETSLDTDVFDSSEENLFETEMASDWELEPANEEAADNFLDWEGANAEEATENLDDFLSADVDEVTDAQDWDDLLTTEQNSDALDIGTSELDAFGLANASLSEDWDFEAPSDEAAAALELDWETADNGEATSLEASDLSWSPQGSLEEPLLAAQASADEWEDLNALLGPEVEETGIKDDFSSLAAQEEDQELAHDFDDLEALLAEDTSVAESELDGFDSDREVLALSSQMSEFEDLEALLADEAVAPAAELTDLNALDDLDALLLEQTPTAHRQSSQRVNRSSLNTDVLEDEFGDLEKLLEQADTMGGPPIANTNQPQARPSIRQRPNIREQTMRVPIKHLDSLSNLVGELVVNRNSLEQDQERLRQFLDNLSHQVLALSDVGSRMQDLYERTLLESSLLASRQNSRSAFNSERSSYSSHTSDVEYDPLEMDRFTGFHLLSQEMIELIVRVRESASDIEFLVDETDQVARMLRQVTTQLQEGLTRSRMVPFAQTADRLPRAVREISLKLRKEAQLHVEGRDTLIDKMLLEHLYDPMTHLVNNAITHGIESPEVRQAAGKPIAGQITLRAFHQGNQTVISISDDGAGINPQQVRNKAVEQRLITPAEARTLTPLDLYDFLFHPGFSTKDKADDFSGRGVGMDVVRTSLSECRGSIHIDSTLGKGTTFTIRLPLTLSICKALCCLSDRARIAFPMDGVEDMLDLSPERIQTNSDNQTCIQWRDTLLPFQQLSELLTYNRQLSRGTVYGGKREDDMISIVVLRSAGNFIAIQVDQVLGEQEIVIKQLEGPAPKPVGIAGATVLGDGRIMPIADVLELIDLASGRIRKDGGVSLWSREESDLQVPTEIIETPSEPMVLIVDDSITVRELLSMTFSKAGYRVEQARDGQEAWDKLRSGLPCDIVFCDIEMPRMDGLELLSRLQKDENLSHLPIAMLTSRGADRHRQMASQLGANGYFTKPYLEEVLLEAAQRMIKGEVLFGSSSNA